MLILVTGGSGFIGSHVVERLSADGYHVRVLDRELPTDGAFGSHRPEVVVAEVGDPGVMDAALVGVDLVCHQAAKVGLGIDVQDLPGYVTDNALATAELLAAMDRAQVMRLLLASSMVVYGEGRYRCSRHGELPAPPRTDADLAAARFEPLCPTCGGPLVPELVSEDSDTDPRNAYAATKLTQEQLTTSWARQGGGSAIALRYHNVYGPRMPRNTPYAGVASIFRSAIANGESPDVYEDGGQRRDFVHVRDVAGANEAAIRALFDGRLSAGRTRAYNVGSGHVRTVLDLASSLSRALDGPAPTVSGRYRLGDVRHITASSERARAELGWQAAVDFESGMRELALEY